MARSQKHSTGNTALPEGLFFARLQKEQRPDWLSILFGTASSLILSGSFQKNQVCLIQRCCNPEGLSVTIQVAFVLTIWQRIFAKRGEQAHSANLQRIQIQPLSRGKQQAVLEKWRSDTEGESKISHTVLEFLEES